MSEKGFKIAENGNSEIEYLTVRDYLEHPELDLDKMQCREIKIGDKVRIIKGPLVNPDYIGRICTVASITDGEYIQFSDCDSVWTPDVLELVEHEDEVTPIDKRTAFLTRLQTLLKEFDACVMPWPLSLALMKEV